MLNPSKVELRRWKHPQEEAEESIGIIDTGCFDVMFLPARSPVPQIPAGCPQRPDLSLSIFLIVTHSLSVSVSEKYSE